MQRLTEDFEMTVSIRLENYLFAVWCPIQRKVITLARRKMLQIGNAVPVGFEIGYMIRGVTYPFEECQFLAVLGNAGAGGTEATPVRQALGLGGGSTGSLIEGHDPIVTGIGNGARFPDGEKQSAIGENCIAPRRLGFRGGKNRSNGSAAQIAGHDTAWHFVDGAIPDALPVREPMKTTNRSILISLVEFPRVSSVRPHQPDFAIATPAFVCSKGDCGAIWRNGIGGGLVANFVRGAAKHGDDPDARPL